MISLKKNDKIIVILALAALVIAGIGIAAYNPPEPENDINPTFQTTYHVSWETHKETYPLSDTFYAGKNEPYSKDITITQDNLLSVKIDLTWTDDHTYGLIRRKGLDTLTLEITCNGQTKTIDQVGNGTMTVEFYINNLPNLETISADSLTDAEERVKNQYYDNTDQSITIQVRVQTGERIFRLFKYLRDKGNNFDLTIQYTYFEGLITETNEEIKNTNQNTNQNTDDSWQPPYLSMILKTGCARYI